MAGDEPSAAISRFTDRRSIHRAIRELKDERYTDENRCLPCTVLNLGIAAVGAIALGLWLGGRSPRGLLAAGLVLGAASVVIYVRGYLIPGTPALTRRFLPDRIRTRLGKSAVDGGRAVASDVDPEALFERLGIVDEAPDGSDLVLDTEFETAWIDAVDTFAGTTDDLRRQLADAIGVDPGSLELERRPGSFLARHEDVPLARWESKAACQADVAAMAIMPLFDSQWGQRSFETRSELLGALRLFLEVCPTCRGHVSLGHEVVTSCCSDSDVVAATCEGCRARVFEVTIDPTHFEAEDRSDRVERH